MSASIFDEITEWQEEQFAGAGWRGALRHLLRETEELLSEIEAATAEVGNYGFMREDRIESLLEEAADVLFMANQLANLLCLSFEETVAEKLSKNIERSWPVAPDGEGVFEHDDNN